MSKNRYLFDCDRYRLSHREDGKLRAIREPNSRYSSSCRPNDCSAKLCSAPAAQHALKVYATAVAKPRAICQNNKSVNLVQLNQFKKTSWERFLVTQLHGELEWFSVLNATKPTPTTHCDDARFTAGDEASFGP